MYWIIGLVLAAVLAFTQRGRIVTRFVKERVLRMSILPWAIVSVIFLLSLRTVHLPALSGMWSGAMLIGVWYVITHAAKEKESVQEFLDKYFLHGRDMTTSPYSTLLKLVLILGAILIVPFESFTVLAGWINGISVILTIGWVIWRFVLKADEQDTITNYITRKLRSMRDEPEKDVEKTA